MMQDSIADMLTRIRNASMVKKADVLVPYSKINLNIAKILEKEKYLQKVEIIEDGFNGIKIALRYDAARKPVITSIQKVSKVGSRVYVGKDGIPTILNGYGIAVISTSKGIMTNKEARKIGVGGEVICEIY
ncbi:30S ribosomal protein S8 [Patescibacteria group bacterium]|nr:30S ribosomal protein S8 [Patescibacteria group bacterium]